MARKGKLRISVVELVYIAYIVRLVFDDSIAGIVRKLLSGNITDNIIDMALDTLDRIEEEGLEIAVNATVVTMVKNKIVRPMIGRRKMLDLGFAVLTV